MLTLALLSLWLLAPSATVPEPISTPVTSSTSEAVARRIPHSIPLMGQSTPDEPGAPAYGPIGSRPSRLFPDTFLGRKLEEHWQVATTPARTLQLAEEAYEAAMAALRAYPAEAAELLEEAYWKSDEWQYESRFTLASTLSDLGSPEAYEPLLGIATETYPPERESDPHSSTHMDERIVRMRAVDGLADLAQNGLAEAERSLLEIAQQSAEAGHDSVAIRAIRGYVAAAPDTFEGMQQIQAVTPERLHWAATAKEPTLDEIRAQLPTPQDVEPAFRTASGPH